MSSWQNWAWIGSPWLATGSCSVRLKRTTFRILSKPFPALRDIIFSPKRAKIIAARFAARFWGIISYEYPIYSDLKGKFYLARGCSSQDLQKLVLWGHCEPPWTGFHPPGWPQLLGWIVLSWTALGWVVLGWTVLGHRAMIPIGANIFRWGRHGSPRAETVSEQS